MLCAQLDSHTHSETVRKRCHPSVCLAVMALVMDYSGFCPNTLCVIHTYMEMLIVCVFHRNILVLVVHTWS